MTLMIVPEILCWYSLEGLSLDGGIYSVYFEEKHTEEDRAKIIRYIRNQQDVVKLHKRRIEDYENEIYKQAINDIKHFEKTHEVKL